MTLSGTVASSSFGQSVSVSGSTVVVGAPNNQGGAYIYYGCTSARSTTCKDAYRVTLTGPFANSQFGSSVSVSGSTVVVGGGGNAYIYYGCTSNSSFTCNDANRIAFMGLYSSSSTTMLFILDSTLIVGGGGNTYIYYGCTSVASTTCNNANRIALPVSIGNSGHGLSISGSTVAIGAGAVFVYFDCISSTSITCNDANRIVLRGPASLNRMFANSVSISDGLVVAGDYGVNNYKGNAYLYYGCTSIASVTCNDANRITLARPVRFDDSFGASVFVSGNIAIAGGFNSAIIYYVTGTGELYYIHCKHYQISTYCSVNTITYKIYMY